MQNAFPDKAIVALKWIVGILNEQNIPYQVSGGFAAKCYGSERELNDIDIDVPEEHLPKLGELVQEYITDGLAHQRDGKWDLEVMTLNYRGQVIDIGGACEGKVSNKERTEWISIPSDLSKAKRIDIGGLVINVESPEELIGYKQYLDGDHQAIDIQAAKVYLAQVILS